MMKDLTPSALRPPFANYAHGVEIPAGWRVVRSSGQLGIRSDDSIPQSAFDQACVCFDAITQILAAGNMTAADVAHITAFVTDRAYMADYMRARDAFVAGCQRLPASTLLIVSGFTRPEFKVEVEVMAAAP